MSNHETCYCKDKHTIVIDRRSASRMTSCLALAVFLVFATGYFVGKRHSVQEELESHELALFANRIQYAIDEQCNLTEADAQEQADSLDQEHITLAENNVHATENVSAEATPDDFPLITAASQSCEPQQNNVRYVALLAGYGTKQAAQQFVQRLEKKGIKAEIKDRVSTNSQKKSRKWYQVTTEKYDSKQALTLLVGQIKGEEHLGNDVRIVEIA